MSGPVRAFASGGQWRILAGATLNTTPPSPPTIVETAFSSNTLTVTLVPPISNGGNAITSYTVQAVPTDGGSTITTSGAGPSLDLTNLLAGVTYMLTAYATNAVGNGTTSAPVLFAIPPASYVKPQAYNTGYPHGLPGDSRTPVTLTTISGSGMTDLIEATAGNVTFTGYDIQGPFDLRRDNITFQSCKFTGIPGTSNDGGHPFVIAGGDPQPTKVTFIDCEFAGNGISQPDPNGDLNAGWAMGSPCNVTTQVHIRSDIWGFQDGFHAGNNGRYESCYIHDLTFYYTTGDETHNDGFQFEGECDNFAVVGCNFELADSTNLSAIMQYNGGVTPNFVRTNITITNNWFQGGGYYVFSGAPTLENEIFSMVMAYNRFDLQSGLAQIWYPHPSWAQAIDEGKLLLIDNVWDATGTTTYGAQVTEGTLIPNPEP